MADNNALNFEISFEDPALTGAVQVLIESGDFGHIRRYAMDQHAQDLNENAEALGRIADIFENRAKIAAYLESGENWEASQSYIEQQRGRVENHFWFNHSEPQPEGLYPEEEMIFAAEEQILLELNQYDEALTTLKENLKAAGRIQTEELRKFYDESEAKVYGYDGSIFVDAELNDHKITEADLAKHESFIKASKILFEKENPGQSWDSQADADGKIDGQTAGEWGVHHMSQFNNQLMEVGEKLYETLMDDSVTPEQRMAFIYANEAFEYSQDDLNSFARAAGYSITDPANLLSLAAAIVTMGGSVAAGQAAKVGATQTLKALIIRQVTSKTALTLGGVEALGGATEAAGQNIIIGKTEENIGKRGEYSYWEAVPAALIGGATDFAAGNVLGAVGNLAARKIGKVFAKSAEAAPAVKIEAPRVVDSADADIHVVDADALAPDTATPLRADAAATADNVTTPASVVTEATETAATPKVESATTADAPTAISVVPDEVTKLVRAGDAVKANISDAPTATLVEPSVAKTNAKPGAAAEGPKAPDADLADPSKASTTPAPNTAITPKVESVKPVTETVETVTSPDAPEAAKADAPDTNAEVKPETATPAEETAAISPAAREANIASSPDALVATPITSEVTNTARAGDAVKANVSDGPTATLVEPSVAKTNANPGAAAEGPKAPDADLAAPSKASTTPAAKTATLTPEATQNGNVIPFPAQESKPDAADAVEPSTIHTTRPSVASSPAMAGGSPHYGGMRRPGEVQIAAAPETGSGSGGSGNTGPSGSTPRTTNPTETPLDPPTATAETIDPATPVGTPVDPPTATAETIDPATVVETPAPDATVRASEPETNARTESPFPPYTLEEEASIKSAEKALTDALGSVAETGQTKRALEKIARVFGTDFDTHLRHGSIDDWYANVVDNAENILARRHEYPSFIDNEFEEAVALLKDKKFAEAIADISNRSKEGNPATPASTPNTGTQGEGPTESGSIAGGGTQEQGAGTLNSGTTQPPPPNNSRSFGARALSLTGKIAYKTADAFRLTDLYYLGKHTPTYIARSFWWPKMHNDFTWALFRKFEALKDNSTTNMLLNLDASYAVTPNKTTANLLYKNPDDSIKYDVVGSLKNLGKHIGSASQDAPVSQSLSKLKSTYDSAQGNVVHIQQLFQGTESVRNITDSIRQQAENSRLTGNSSVTNTSYTPENAKQYIEATIAQIENAYRSNLAGITDRTQRQAVKTHLDNIKNFAEETVQEIEELPADGALSVNIATQIQNYASSLTKVSENIDNEALTPVYEQIRQMARRDAKTVSETAQATQAKVNEFSSLTEKLDTSIERIKNNIRSINRNPDEEMETYVGGTITARLLAYDIQPGVKIVDDFAHQITERTKTTLSAVDTATQSTDAAYKKLLEALDSGKDTNIRRALSSLTENLDKQEQNLTNIPSVVSDDVRSSFSDAANTAQEMAKKARTYTFDTTHRKLGNPKHTAENPGENRYGGKDMGFGILTSLTKWMIRQEVGLVDREVTRADINRAKRLIKLERGSNSLPSGTEGLAVLRGRWRYMPHERVTTHGGKKGDTHKFLEQAFRGMEKANATDNTATNKKILEQTVKFLNKQDANGLIEAYKWLATYYSSESPILDKNGNPTKKTSTDRTMGITNELLAMIDERRQRLVASGEMDRFSGDVIQTIRNMQSAQVSLGANNIRRGWRKAVNDVTNRRFDGDFKNEFWDSSPAEHGPARKWFFKTRLGYLNPVMWSFRSKKAFLFNSTLIGGTAYGGYKAYDWLANETPDSSREEDGAPKGDGKGGADESKPDDQTQDPGKAPPPISSTGIIVGTPPSDGASNTGTPPQDTSAATPPPAGSSEQPKPPAGPAYSGDPDGAQQNTVQVLQNNITKHQATIKALRTRVENLGAEQIVTILDELQDEKDFDQKVFNQGQMLAALDHINAQVARGNFTYMDDVEILADEVGDVEAWKRVKEGASNAGSTIGDFLTPAVMKDGDSQVGGQVSSAFNIAKAGLGNFGGLIGDLWEDLKNPNGTMGEWGPNIIIPYGGAFLISLFAIVPLAKKAMSALMIDRIPGLGILGSLGAFGIGTLAVGTVIHNLLGQGDGTYVPSNVTAQTTSPDIEGNGGTDNSKGDSGGDMLMGGGSDDQVAGNMGHDGLGVRMGSHDGTATVISFRNKDGRRTMSDEELATLQGDKGMNGVPGAGTTVAQSSGTHIPPAAVRMMSSHEFNIYDDRNGFVPERVKANNDNATFMKPSSAFNTYSPVRADPTNRNQIEITGNGEGEDSKVVSIAATKAAQTPLAPTHEQVVARALQQEEAQTLDIAS